LRGEFTRVEIGHMVIASAANGRNRSLGSGFYPEPSIEVLAPEDQASPNGDPSFMPIA
jgi:hypothetical protein